MALRKASADPSPARLCRLLADYLNEASATVDRELLGQVERLLAPLGVASWPDDVSAQHVARWGLSSREAAQAIDDLRALGVQLR
jgi:hypothetical protein